MGKDYFGFFKRAFDGDPETFKAFEDIYDKMRRESVKSPYTQRVIDFLEKGTSEQGGDFINIFVAFRWELIAIGFNAGFQLGKFGDGNF